MPVVLRDQFVGFEVPVLDDAIGVCAHEILAGFVHILSWFPLDACDS